MESSCIPSGKPTIRPQIQDDFFPPDFSSNKPKVRLLGEQLGFGDGRANLLHSLTASTTLWRKQYICPDRTLGTELTDWYEPLVQYQLKTMALDYLKSSGNGVRWWPKSAHEAEDEYWKDMEGVHKILTKLMWLQNDFFKKNQEHKKQRTELSQERSRTKQITVNKTHASLESTEGSSFASTATDSSHALKSSKSCNPEVPKPALPLKNVAPLRGYRNEGQDSITKPKKWTYYIPSTDLQRDGDFTDGHGERATSEDIVYSDGSDVENVRSTNDPPRLVLKFVKTNEGLYRIAAPSPDTANAPLPEQTLQPYKSSCGTFPSPTNWSPPHSEEASADHQGELVRNDKQKEGAQDVSPEIEGNDDSPGDEVRVDGRGDEGDGHEQFTSFHEDYEGSFHAIRVSTRVRKPRFVIVDQTSEEDTEGSDEEELADKVEPVLAHPEPRSAEKVSLQRESSGRFKRKSTTSNEEGKQGQWKRACPVQARERKPADGRCVQDEDSTLEEAFPPKRPSTPASITLQTDDNPDAQSTGISGERNKNTVGEVQAKESATQEMSNRSAGPKRPVKASFIIIKGRGPFPAQEGWPEGKLKGKSTEFVFDAASRIAQRTDFEQIKCTLYTARLSHTEILQKRDEESFTRMEKAFGEEIMNACKKNNNEGRDFKIYIDPVYREEPSMGAAAEDGDADVMVDW